MSRWNDPWLGDEIQKLLDQEKRWREVTEDRFGEIRKTLVSDRLSSLAEDFRTETERMIDAATSSLAQLSRADTSYDRLQDLMQGIGRDQARDLSRLAGERSLTLAIQSHAQQMAEISAAAEGLYARTDWERLRASISTDSAARLESASRQLASDYRMLIDSLAEGLIYTISPNLSMLPPVEVFLAGDLAYSFSPSDVEEPEVASTQGVRVKIESSELPELGILLSQISPDLCVMLDGARRALIGDNPDRVRHVTTTLREVFTQVLHHLSPDSDVTAWSKDPSHFSNGRPTRRARLLFIVQPIESKQLRRFLESDVNAALEFLDAFQAGTHGPPGKFNDDQLRAMLVRMEGLLRFLLEVRRGGSAEAD